MNLVETVGNAPTAAILQGSPALLCCPRARGPYRADSCASSARRNDLICHPGFNVVRTAGIEPTSSKWHSEAQPIDHVRPIVWWEADGIEPLAPRDCVYGAATGHQPVLIGASR